MKANSGNPHSNCIAIWTHWGWVTHICVSNLSIIGSDNGLITWSASSSYLNQCWNIVKWTLRNKLKWNLNQNSNIFIEENAFESVVCEMSAILSRPQCVKFVYLWVVLLQYAWLSHNATQQAQQSREFPQLCMVEWYIYIYIYITNPIDLFTIWHSNSKEKTRQYLLYFSKYQRSPNRGCTLVDNKIVDHSYVVGVGPVSAAPNTSSFVA